MTNWKKYFFIALCSSAIVTAYADVTIPIHLTSANGIGKSIGTITAADTQYGLLLTPHLTDLSPGTHGFHVHQNPSCAELGMAAGSHLDPEKTGKHAGPYTNNGHLGDLPALVVDKNGDATMPLLAPRLKLADIEGHSLIIHAGGDNYSDTPPLGGGGARVACGVVLPKTS